MKHIKTVTQAPKSAATVGIGQILTILAQIMTILGGALTAKTSA